VKDVRCSRCGRGYDASLFREERVVLCECGQWVDPAERASCSAPVELRRTSALSSPGEGGRAEAREDVDDLARRADRVTALLLYSDVPEIDLRIEMNELKEHVRSRFPDRVELFEMVYESRWRRFREQGWAREHREI
jgi:hypothetical protein